jgi:hypothetical protein
MTKFWHVFSTIGLATIAIVTPAIKIVIAAHPVVSVALATAWALLGSLLPSPLPINNSTK